MLPNDDDINFDWYDSGDGDDDTNVNDDDKSDNDDWYDGGDGVARQASQIRRWDQITVIRDNQRPCQGMSR